MLTELERRSRSRCLNPLNPPILITHPITQETKCRREWASELGITQSALNHRLKKYPIEIALDNANFPSFEERRRKVRHPVTGEEMTVHAWADRLKYSVERLKTRIREMPIEEALTPNPRARISHQSCKVEPSGRMTPEQKADLRQRIIDLQSDA